MKNTSIFFLMTISGSIHAQVFSTPGGTVSNNGTSDHVYVNGQTRLINPNGRKLMIERDNEDSWLTFHDPGDYWYSMGVDRSNSGAFIINSGGLLQYPHFVMNSSGFVGIGTATPQTLFNIAQGAGNPTVGTAAFRIGGANNYASLELGIKGSYDGMISTYGNDLHIYAGHWRTAGATATEDHSISFYTSQAASTNWNTAKMFLRHDGNLGIGTTAPNEKLTVNGTVYGKEVKVDLNVPAPDYVFEKDYILPSLEEIKNYIDLNKHLPEVPSAKEMQANGINVGEMNMILLKKIEELTLYMIALKKENEEIKERLKMN